MLTAQARTRRAPRSADPSAPVLMLRTRFVREHFAGLRQHKRWRDRTGSHEAGGGLHSHDGDHSATPHAATRGRPEDRRRCRRRPMGRIRQWQARSSWAAQRPTASSMPLRAVIVLRGALDHAEVARGSLLVCKQVGREERESPDAVLCTPERIPRARHRLDSGSSCTISMRWMPERSRRIRKSHPRWRASTAQTLFRPGCIALGRVLPDQPRALRFLERCAHAFERPPSKIIDGEQSVLRLGLEVRKAVFEARITEGQRDPHVCAFGREIRRKAQAGMKAPG